MEVPSTPPIVPLVASSPSSIEATLVDDRGRGHGRTCGRGAHGGLHVSLIEPSGEHAHHRHPQRKRNALRVVHIEDVTTSDLYFGYY